MSTPGIWTTPGGARLSWPDRILYGVGSAAIGIKESGFNVLLILFYNQVLGLPAAAVGTAIMIALVIDGVTDPLIGLWSDNLRSRFGRRHPLMYVAAVALATSYYLLFNPPSALSAAPLFCYLLVVASLTRIASSLYEIPSSALLIDFTQDYDLRTRLISVRYFFVGLGAVGMGAAAFSLFVPGGPHHAAKSVDMHAYGHYGMTAAAVMVAAILTSSLTTQRFAYPSLSAERVASLTPRKFLRKVRQELFDKPCLLLSLSTFFSYAAAGVAGAMATYMRLYFWELKGPQISLLILANAGSAVAALVGGPLLAEGLGKKRAVILAAAGAIVLGPMLSWSRLLGIVPPNGTPAIFWLLLASGVLTTALVMCVAIVGSSMFADVVEYNHARTGKKSAGLLFSINALLSKSVTGVGVGGAGLILTLVAFPSVARPGMVPHDVLFRLGLFEPLIIFALQATAFFLILPFPITREMHERTLAYLRSQPDSDERTSVPPIPDVCPSFIAARPATPSR